MHVEWDVKKELAKDPADAFKQMVQNTWTLYERLKLSPGWEEEIAIFHDKIFVNESWKVAPGVIIIPRDGSYIRYIGAGWYDGQDPESI